MYSNWNFSCSLMIVGCSKTFQSFYHHLVKSLDSPYTPCILKVTKATCIKNNLFIRFYVPKFNFECISTFFCEIILKSEFLKKLISRLWLHTVHNCGNLLSHFFDKNFVKTTFFLITLLNSWFDEKIIP